MKEVLFFVGILELFVFLWIIWKMKFSATSIFLLSFIVFYVIGFLVVGLNPDSSIWGYLEPDIRRHLAFPLGTGDSQIRFITMVNSSLLIGIFIGLFTTSGTLLFNKKLRSIPPKNENFIMPLAWFFFIGTLCYEALRLYFVPNLPLYKLILGNSSTGALRILGDQWLSEKNIPWIFLPSIYMQFLQFFLPLASLLFYMNYDLKKTKSSFYIFLLSLIVNFFNMLTIFKRGPFIMFGVCLFLVFILYSKKISLKNCFTPISAIFIILFGLFGMTQLQRMDFSHLCSDKPEKSSFQLSIDGKSKSIFEFSEKTFKTSKIPLDFNSDMQKSLREYHDKLYGNMERPTAYSTISSSLSRVLVIEMLATFAIVGNEELMEFVKTQNPFYNYIRKIFDPNVKNIYEIMLCVLEGQYCKGSTTISFFLEAFIFYGNFSIVLFIMIGYLLIRFDSFVVNKLDMSFIPVIVLLNLVIAHAPLKGLMTTIFTVGGISSLFLFFIFYTFFFKKDFFFALFRRFFSFFLKK